MATAPSRPRVTFGLVFLVGTAFGALVATVWDDLIELLELYREQR